MDYLSMLGISLMAAGMVMLLKQMYPPAAALITIAFGVMMLSALLPGIREYVGAVSAFLSRASLRGEYGAVMLKAMGIVLVTQLSVQFCQDMDAPSIARRAEFCGRIALLGVALPVFMTLTRMAVDVLR